MSENQKHQPALLQLVSSLPKECPICGSDQRAISCHIPVVREYQATAKYECGARLCIGTPAGKGAWESECGDVRKVALALIEKHGR